MMKGATKSVYLLVLCVCAMAWKDDTDADAVKKLGESGATDNVQWTLFSEPPPPFDNVHFLVTFYQVHRLGLRKSERYLTLP